MKHEIHHEGMPVQQPYNPTQGELRLALWKEIAADPGLPVRVGNIIDRAFARANAGEFK